jgi:WD40 repeat protein
VEVRRPPNVFVSWAHGAPDWTSPEVQAWRSEVASFVDALRKFGIDAQVDLHHLSERGMDWTRYGPRAISEHEWVLAALSPSWRERWEGRNAPTEGAGAAAETDALRSLFAVNQQTFRDKLVLVTLPSMARTDHLVPIGLHGVQRIDVADFQLENLADLLRLLTGQGSYPARPVGNIPALPTATTAVDVDKPAGQERAAYFATIADIAPTELKDRGDELALLAKAANGPPGYLRLVGGPWAGKTALASHFACAPPVGVDVLGYFLSRSRGDADSERLVQALDEQLTALLGTQHEHLDNADTFRVLWRQCSRRAAQLRRHLVLMVDGLDEDSSGRIGLPSVAQLLPTRLEPWTHVIVCSRPFPDLPDDLSADHPLRCAATMQLRPSRYAAKLALRARTDLYGLLGKRDTDQIATAVLGTLAAAEGPLSISDLAELARLSDPTVSRPEVVNLITNQIGRVLEPTDHSQAVRLTFAHETLRATVVAVFDSDLTIYRARIYDWAKAYEARDWPPTTPLYLLDSFPALARHDSPSRLLELYSDVRYIELAIMVLGARQVAAELHAVSEATSDRFVTELAGVIDRQAEYLGEVTPTLDTGYVARQLLVQALDRGALVVAERARSRLDTLPSPRVIPRWTRGQAHAALVRTFNSDSHAVALSADGELAITVNDDNTVRSWNLATGDIIQEVYDSAPVCWTASACARGRTALSASRSDSSVRVWDLVTGDVRHVLHGHTGYVDTVQMSRDGKRAISTSTEDSLRVWDTEAGAAIAVLTAADIEITHDAFRERLFASMSGDGSRALISVGIGPAILWDLESNCRLGPLGAQRSTLYHVALSDDATRAVTVEEGAVLMWDTSACAPIATLPFSDYVSEIALSGDGQVVAFAARSFVHVWDVADDGRCQPWRGHIGDVRSLAIDFTGRRVVSVASDDTLRLWERPNGHSAEPALAHPGYVTCSAARTTGSWVVTSSAAERDDDGSGESVNSSGTLLVWHASTGDPIAVLDGHTDDVTAVVMSDDGGRAVSLSRDGSMRVWDLSTLTVVQTLDAGFDCFALAANETATVIAAVGMEGGYSLWDLRADGVNRRVAGDGTSVDIVALSENEETLVTAGFDGSVLVWNLAFDRIAARLDLGPNFRVLAIDAERLEIVGQVGTDPPVVLNFSSSHPRVTLDADRHIVILMAHDSRSRIVAGVSRDGVLYLWDLDTGRRLATARLTPNVQHLGLTSAKHGQLWLIAGETNGTVTFYDIEI